MISFCFAYDVMDGRSYYEGLIMYEGSFVDKRNCGHWVTPSHVSDSVALLLSMRSSKCCVVDSHRHNLCYRNDSNVSLLVCSIMNKPLS